MNRVKFALFALAALGLWGAHVWLVSGSAGAAAEEQALERLRHVSPAVSRSVEAAKVEMLEYAAALSSSAELAAALLPPPPLAADPAALPVPQPEVPALDRFEKARGLAQSLAPEARRAELLVAWRSGEVALAAKGAEAPLTQGVDFAALEALGAGEGTLTAFETQWVVRALSFHGQPGTRLYVGFPEQLPDVGRLAQEAGFDGMVVFKAGAAVHRGGEQGAQLVEWLGDVPSDGTGAIIKRGAEGALGPVRLPLLTHGDWLGGQAPQWAAIRQKVSGTPWEVAVMVRVEGMAHFANVQKLGLLGLLGLFVFALGWTFFIRNDGGDEGGISMPQPKAPPPPMGMRRNSGIEALSLTALGNPAAPPPPPSAEASVIVNPAAVAPAARVPAKVESPPEASPDDFDLAAAGPSNPFDGGPMPFDAPAPAPAPPPAAAAAARPPPPAAAAAPPPPPPPAAAAAPPPPPPAAFGPGFTGERLPLPAPRRAGDHETRPNLVVPAEFKAKLAAQRAAESAPAVALAPAPGPAGLDAAAALVEAAAASVDEGPNPDDPEEVHWWEVFQELKAKKKECGEPEDGHPWPKFRTKLEATRDQVKQKFGCRGVRFSVQVKDGKASLKAAPIK